jgi:hypothetical protein
VIRRDISFEELVAACPESVRYLLGKGIQAIACGEPAWGTLEEAARAKGYTDAEIDLMAAELSRPQ